MDKTHKTDMWSQKRSTKSAELEEINPREKRKCACALEVF